MRKLINLIKGWFLRRKAKKLLKRDAAILSRVTELSEKEGIYNQALLTSKDATNQAFQKDKLIDETLVKISSENEKIKIQLSKINQALGASEAGLNKFSNDLFEIARTTTASFHEIAELAAIFARRGLSAEDIVKKIKITFQ